MRAIDDAGTLVQDNVVRDLKALSARDHALETSVKQRFDSAEKLCESPHKLMVLRMESRFGAFDSKFTGMLAAMEARFSAVDGKFALSDARMAAGFAAVDAKLLRWTCASTALAKPVTRIVGLEFWKRRRDLQRENVTLRAKTLLLVVDDVVHSL